MFIQVDRRDGATVVALDGNLDAMTAPRLSESLSELLQEDRSSLVIDFGAVGYISSAGLRTLLATVKEARSKGGDLRLAAVREDVHKVFDMSGFTSIFQIYGEAEEAVVSFAG